MKDNLPELTLLNEKQIWGSRRLKVIENYGTKTAITDLAILTGGYVSDYHVAKDKGLAGRTGSIWTSSDDKDNDVHAVAADGSKYSIYRYQRRRCVRPALHFSATLIGLKRIKGYADEVEYGEYPQMAADANMQRILEREYEKRTIRATGKTYTFDSRKYNDYNNGFSPVVYEEYEYQGKKYIRIKANMVYDEKEKLSNGLEVQAGDYVWVKVQPVRWLVDKDTQTLVSKKGLVSGIRYQDRAKPYTGNFKETGMYTYMNTYLVKDLFHTTQLVNTANLEEEKEEDEIQSLISKIRRLIEPMDDQKEQEIVNKVNQLIDNYDHKLETIKPELSFNTMATLVQEDSFQSLKLKLINQLEAIIQSLYENDNLLTMLDNINHYRELAKQKVDIPSSILEIEDKIIYMIAVSRICERPIIIQQLDNLFEQVTAKISMALFQSCEQEISLTLENQQNVQKLFSKMVESNFEVVKRYYIVQMALRGIGESDLAKEVQKLYQILGALDEEKQKKYDLEFEKIREEINLDVCVNNDIEKIFGVIEKRIELIARMIKFYGGAVEEAKKEIMELLENPNIPHSIKEQSKQELTKILEEWGKRVENNEEVINDNPLYQNLTNDTIIQLQCLKELYNIKYHIEMYLSNLSKYDNPIKGI